MHKFWEGGPSAGKRGISSAPKGSRPKDGGPSATGNRQRSMKNMEGAREGKSGK